MRIEDYFDDLRRLVGECRFIFSESLSLTKYSLYSGKIRGTLLFRDNSQLYLVEVVDVEFRMNKFRYGYQYLKGNKQIFRYDNSPHYPELENFPHHKHIGKKVIGISEPSFRQILREVEKILFKQG